ncbi:hypothetical protein [Halothiobacillus sp.]|uniref:hypothetical protein n=1 Tax=Halothiobacillus sp. TaxID=1891311 RepID=UPI0019877354|nr:hypothetical protein [Halothiobacillus sp.]MBD3813701.1 metal transporter [Betaproteobacteria bacterium]MDD4965624.1 hypothetical protein [Halothiobacillus sp.]
MTKQGRTISTRVVQRLTTLLPWLPWLIPLMLAPLLIGWAWKVIAPAGFSQWREELMFAYLMYIVIVRFALLDVMLFYVAHKRRSMHLDLLRLVFLYLEVTAFTLLFFALMYLQFDVFDLFAYNGKGVFAHSDTLQAHPFRVSLYISVALFTTLGIGDWVPQTLNAMMAAGIEAILGFIQGGVFFAVLIYAHQDKRQDSGSSAQ